MGEPDVSDECPGSCVAFRGDGEHERRAVGARCGCVRGVNCPAEISQIGDGEGLGRQADVSTESTPMADPGQFARGGDERRGAPHDAEVVGEEDGADLHAVDGEVVSARGGDRRGGDRGGARGAGDRIRGATDAGVLAVHQRRIQDHHDVAPGSPLAEAAEDHQPRPALARQARQLQARPRLRDLSPLTPLPKDNNGVVQPILELRESAVDIIMRIGFGDEFCLNNAVKVKELDQNFRDIMDAGSIFQIALDSSAFVRTLLFSAAKKRYDNIRTISSQITERIMPIILERKKLLQERPCSDSVTFVDALINLKGEDKLTDMEIVWNVAELMVGGTDNTSHILEWILAEMVT